MENTLLTIANALIVIGIIAIIAAPVLAIILSIVTNLRERAEEKHDEEIEQCAYENWLVLNDLEDSVGAKMRWLDTICDITPEEALVIYDLA
jgi:hypothetical protein